MPSKSSKVVGIDLAGSERRATGFCLLERNRADVSVLLTDEDIIRAVGKGVRAAAIDAPLSLPRGRCCLKDDCPCVGKAHFRVCDLELRRMGIKFFPITLGPMRQLTLRGLRLKEKLESRGIEVFETYPGAAQDIWGIPRQKNPQGLKRGLSVDTNCDPDLVEYPIAGNDDAIRSVRMILSVLVQVVTQARAEYEAKFARRKIEERAPVAEPEVSATPASPAPESVTAAPVAVPFNEPFVPPAPETSTPA